MKNKTSRGNVDVGLIIIVGLIWGVTLLFSDDKEVVESNSYYKGDMSQTGGTPTYRYEDIPVYEDDEYTTNNESNDQAVGFYGTETMNVCNQSSGNCYDLDVDSDGENIERIYCPKGGWVDVEDSDCVDGSCTATDENGNEWELEY